MSVEVKQSEPSAGRSSLGIDLGLKDLASFSDGSKIEAQAFYRDLEPGLAVAQQANQKDRVKAKGLAELEKKSLPLRRRRNPAKP